MNAQTNTLTDIFSDTEARLKLHPLERFRLARRICDETLGEEELYATKQAFRDSMTAEALEVWDEHLACLDLDMCGELLLRSLVLVFFMGEPADNWDDEGHVTRKQVLGGIAVMKCAIPLCLANWDEDWISEPATQ